VEEIHQNSTITIAVKEPEVEHRVRIRDFENWLASSGGLLLNKRLRATCELSSIPELSRNPCDDCERLFDVCEFATHLFG